MMGSKKRIHHIWTKFRTIRPLHLGIALVIMLSISALALRNNYQTMTELRQAVYVADEKNGDVEGALRELRQYVYAHMNTDLTTDNAVYPPIQLKHTYERLVAQQQDAARQKNAAIYTEAQKHCERLHPESFSGGPRVPCIRDYVANQGVNVPVVPDSLYKFDFVSPVWSPDFAGWSLVVTAILAFVFVLRLALPIVLKSFRI